MMECLLLRFGRCLDLGDWPSWRSCFTDRIAVDFERLLKQDEVLVDADLWVRAVERAFLPIRRHHTYSNIDIAWDGDRAAAVTYLTTRHWRATGESMSHNTQYGWSPATSMISSRSTGTPACWM